MAQGRKKPREAAPTTADSRAAPGFLEGAGEKPRNWANEPESETFAEARKLYNLVQKSYDNREQANDSIEEYWHIHNAQPDENQQYTGNSQCYVPAVRDAIMARAKRSLKQLFPVRYKHVEALSADGETPYPQLALLEHYIRSTNLKSVVRSDLIAGDVTGQWNLYIDWTRSYRRITKLVKRNPVLEESDAAVRPPELGMKDPLTDPTTEEDATEEEDILDEGPEIVDVATEDVAVVPPTVNDLEKAEVTAIRLRMSKEAITRMVDEGVFVIPEKGNIDQWMQGNKQPDGGREKKNPAKSRSNEAGVRTEGTYSYALIYEAHAMLSFPSEEKGGKPVKRLAYIYFGGPNETLGVIVAPNWGGKRPLISAPVERVKGSFYGISKIEPVKFLQWNLTDYWNMGQDSAMYSLLPIVMTDPLSNPNYAAMVIGLAAVWPTDPNKTKFANFPQLYKESLQICEGIKRQIWESMDVNEMMMGRMPPGRKNNQMMAAFAQDQATNIIDHAERYEEVILNPLVERMMEYDAQYRTSSVTIRQMGEIGVRAKLAEIPPQQWGKRYDFLWAGTSFIQGMQRMQQQIAWMNVLRGIPPQQLAGRRLDVTPIIEAGTEALFGPEVSPRILIDERNLFTVDATVENEILANNMPADVHEADDDAKHIEIHQQGARFTGDANGRFRAHIAAHLMSLKRKQQMQMAQAGQPGAPGPQAGVQGMAGTPRIGAQPGAQRAVQNPPGAIPQDQMTDTKVGGRG